jgi:hypothetical protein
VIDASPRNSVRTGAAVAADVTGIAGRFSCAEAPATKTAVVRSSKIRRNITGNLRINGNCHRGKETMKLTRILRTVMRQPDQAD